MSNRTDPSDLIPNLPPWLPAAVVLAFVLTGAIVWLFS